MSCLRTRNILAANGIQVREIFFHIFGDLGWFHQLFSTLTCHLYCYFLGLLSCNQHFQYNLLAFTKKNPIAWPELSVHRWLLLDNSVKHLLHFYLYILNIELYLCIMKIIGSHQFCFLSSGLCVLSITFIFIRESCKVLTSYYCQWLMVTEIWNWSDPLIIRLFNPT